MVSSLLYAPSPARAEAAGTASSVPEGDPTLKKAWDQAKQSGEKVALPDKFTEYTKIWAAPDGRRLIAEVSSQPIQVKNTKTGIWEPIDTRIVTRDGILRANRVKTPLTFGGKNDRALVTARGEDGDIGIRTPGVLPKPIVSGSRITYPDAVQSGVDLVVTARPDGFLQQVVFRRRPSGAVTIKLPLTIPEGTGFGRNPAGLPQLKNADGPAGDPIAVVAEDANVETVPESARVGKVATRVETDTGKPTLILEPDTAFLADLATVYPVTITAASTHIGSGLPDDTFVSNITYPNSQRTATWLRAGKSASGSEYWETYLKFNLPLAQLEGAELLDAELIVWNYSSGGPSGSLCDDPLGSGIVARRITSSWSPSTLTWSNRPSSASDEGLATGGYNQSGSGWCGHADKLWHSVHGMVSQWLSGATNHGLVLRSKNQSEATNWRQYRSSEGASGEYPNANHAPALMIEYEPTVFYELDVPALPDGSHNPAPYEEALASVQDELFNGETPVVPGISREEAESEARVSDVTFSQDSNTIEEPGVTLEEIAEAEDPANLLPGDPVPAPTPSSDTVIPLVEEVLPAANATDVGTRIEIAVDFDEPVTGGAVVLRDAEGDVVPGTADLPGLLDDPFALYTPEEPLAVSTVYAAEISGFRDANGNTITPYSWTFTTAATPEPEPTFTPVSPPPDPDPPTTPGLVAAWGMNEGTGSTVGDASGQDNHGIAEGTTWTANGKYGQGLYFNGTSGWVTVPHDSSLRPTDALTVSAWVRPSTVSGWRTIAMTDDTLYGLYAADGDGVPSGWFTTGDGLSVSQAPAPLPIGTWSHVAMTYDGSTARIFVNGVETASQPVSGGLEPGNTPLHIGGNSVWGEHFSGVIDEVRIYGIAQNSAQLQADMATAVGATSPSPSPSSSPSPSPSPTPSPVAGLVAAYGMNESSGTTVADTSGRNNTGTATDTTHVPGKYGQGLSFNGTTSWVDVADHSSLRLTSALTVSAWVRPSSVWGWRTVVMKELSAGGAAYALYASDGDTPAGFFSTTFGDGGPEGAGPLLANTWTHLAVTYSGSTARLFVNGTQVGTSPIPAGLMADAGPLRIGGNSVWTNEFFSGVIDEVRVYNIAQTAAQVQADMNTPVGGTGGGATLLAVSGDAVVKLAADTTSESPTLKVWVSAAADDASVEVQVEPQPGKYAKPRRVIWSGRAAISEDGVATLRVPTEKLQSGEPARWRARATGSAGEWSAWQTLSTASVASDLAECRAIPRGRMMTSSGYTRNGHAKNRSQSCYWQERYRTLYNHVGEEEGWMRYRVTVLGYLQQNSRTLKYLAYVDKITEDDNPRGWDKLLKVGFSISEDLFSPGQGSDCVTSAANQHRMATYAEWKAAGDNMFVEANFSSPHDDKEVGDEQRDYCLVRVWATAPDAASSNKSFTFGMKQLVRCDSATYISASGCVYPWAIPHMKLRYEDQYMQQITHIVWALRYPENTQPKKIGRRPINKTHIPGGKLNDRITRTADTDRNERNRDRSVRNCRRVWGAGYATRYVDQGITTDCDEFPFASTYEGSTHRGSNGRFTNKFSVLIIESQQNQDWGRNRLNRFYRKERILDEDTFWINTDDVGFV